MADREMDDLDEFVQELIACQSRLRAYIVASLGNQAHAADVLQRTNLILWKKARTFRPGTAFVSWALRVARYEVLSYRRDHRRDRHIFSHDVAMLMLDAVANEVASPDDREAALRQCLEKLPSRGRTLIWQRYSEDKSIQQIASETGRTKDAVKCQLLRLRKSLEECVEAFLRTSTA